MDTSVVSNVTEALVLKLTKKLLAESPATSKEKIVVTSANNSVTLAKIVKTSLAKLRS